MSKTNLYEGSWFNSPKQREASEQLRQKASEQLIHIRQSASTLQDCRVEGVFNLACDCKPAELRT